MALGTPPVRCSPCSWWDVSARGTKGGKRGKQNRTFWPSLFTLAASNVNHIDVYRSSSVLQLEPLRRDDA